VAIQQGTQGAGRRFFCAGEVLVIGRSPKLKFNWYALAFCLLRMARGIEKHAPPLVHHSQACLETYIRQASQAYDQKAKPYMRLLGLEISFPQ
jgi:hypothetical protein